MRVIHSSPRSVKVPSRNPWFRPGYAWLACCVAVLSVTVSPRAFGAPVHGRVLSLSQPSGARVEVRIWGDEFYHVVESLDGYTLVRDTQSAAACYARLSADGNELISTGIPVEIGVPAGLGLVPHIRINQASSRAKIAAARARFIEQEKKVLGPRSRAAVLSDPPATGNVRAITLIIDFDDRVATIPASNVDDYCNEVGYNGYGNNGSVRDYFYDVSDGNLTYTNFVPDAYYRANELKSWYEDEQVSYGIRARIMITEALEDLDDQGFDFSQYDANGDGLIDGINVFYAGFTRNAWAEGLWPHSSSISFSRDGVDAYRYQITDMTNSLTLYTFCHENGHMICYWPDLYDYDYDSYGVGRFCIMWGSSSDTNPQQPCAALKYRVGWTDTTILTAPQANLEVPSSFNKIYKYEHPTRSSEYYVVENRRSSGRDSQLPDEGLAIWHVDTNGSNSNQEMTLLSHYNVTLVQADGEWDMENYRNTGDSTDLWGAPEYPECTPHTDPNTNWWTGDSSGLYITGISEVDETMYFNFGPSSANVPAPAPPPHHIRKNRFVSFSPNNTEPISIKVEVADLACSDDGVSCSYDSDCALGQTCELVPETVWEVIGWVGEPCLVPQSTQVPADTYTALVVSEMPAPRVLDQLVIQLTDCEIQPRRAYALRASTDGLLFTERLIVGTIREPIKNDKRWADLVGSRSATTGLYTEPNQRINVNDIQAVIVFMNAKSYRPHITIVDLSHEVVNYKINADDLSMVIRAFSITEDYPPYKFQVEASGAVHPRDCPADLVDAVHDKCQ